MSNSHNYGARLFHPNSDAFPERLYEMNTLRMQQQGSTSVAESQEGVTDIHPSSEEPLLDDDESNARTFPTKEVETSVLRLMFAWFPEIFASVLSTGILIAMVMLLAYYNGRALNKIELPNGLTLNGLIAILSTLARVCVMVPTASVLSQEAWLWFSTPKKTRRLIDLEKSEGATRGVLGSLTFLLTSPRRCVIYTP